MNANELWNKFTNKHQVYTTCQFGLTDLEVDQLAVLIRDGIKVATTSAYISYVMAKEKIPEINDYCVVLNSCHEAICIVQITNVYITKFNNVSSEHAYKEGEGDKSLAYWRRVHRQFFEQELNSYNLEFSDDMLVVCEEFKIVYK